MTARPSDPRAGARFHWHPEARLFDHRGVEGARPDPQDDRGDAAGGLRLPDRPGAAALRTALALTMAGPRPFRIGGDAPVAGPDPAGLPLFETLTGGTSGPPRRILRSQDSWLRSFAVNGGLFSIGPGIGVAVLGRLVHSLALYGAVEALHLGASAHLLDGLGPRAQRAALAARAVGVIYATPSQLRLLAEAPGPALPALRVILCGGDRLDPALRAALARMAPTAAVHAFYGAAETSFVTLSGPDDPEDSVGRPYPGVDIAVDSAGILAVRSPYVFHGYADGSGPARWTDDWLRVGEVGRLEGGHVFLLGRAGRMVRIAEQTVHPEAVEALLLAQPGVARAAVLPRPDPLRGQHLVAVLAGDPGREGAILAALRGTLAPVAVPRAVLWRQDWPCLPSGKTDLAALVAILAEGAT